MERIVSIGRESGRGLGVASSVVGAKVLASIGEEVREGEGGSLGDSSIQVDVVIGRVGQSLWVSITVLMVEGGDP
jgi:hypothetical protein